MNTDINIVLAHGIFGFDKIGPINYFNGIEEHLKNRHNASVFVVKVSKSGGIIERGEKLKQDILNAISNPDAYPCFNPQASTHIIAHSMGGLDSRYILSSGNSNNIGHLITSLTTIGTPHKGTPLADFFYQKLDMESPLPLLGFTEEEFVNILTLVGIKKDGIHDLTTDAMAVFNKKYTKNDSVRYFWIAGIGRKFFKTSIFLLVPYTYIALKPFAHYVLKLGPYAPQLTMLGSIGFNVEGNDGAVPLSSAKYEESGWSAEPIGENRYADHFDLIGHDFNQLPGGKPKKFDYLAMYDEIIAMIKQSKTPAQLPHQSNSQLK